LLTALAVEAIGLPKQECDQSERGVPISPTLGNVAVLTAQR